MCLLIVLAQVRDDLPLVVAANRDELLERPATAMAVLRAAGPRVLGGRDEQAGGTWLAVNEHGVVAGLTNRPSADGPSPGRRSRGELPLLGAGERSAADGVNALVTSVARASDYNPAWLLVADRAGAYFVSVEGDGAPAVEALAPGVHVLENRPLHAASPKAAHVRALLAGIEALPSDALVARLAAVLADHDVPDGQSAAAEAGRADVPAAVGACCVHAERYGSRWSGIVRVPPSAMAPSFRYAAGAPCSTPFVDAAW